MPLFTIQQRYKYYFSCCIFLVHVRFFLVRIYPSTLLSKCAFFSCAYIQMRFFSGVLFSYVLFSSALFFRSPLYAYIGARSGFIQPATPPLRGGWTRPQSAKWRHHNRRETSETAPHLFHLTSNPFPHLFSPFHFSSIVLPIVCLTETVSMDI